MATMTEIDDTLYLGEETRPPGRLRQIWRARFYGLIGLLSVGGRRLGAHLSDRTGGAPGY